MEKAPTVIKAGVKKEEAEELKAKLEAGSCNTNLNGFSIVCWILSPCELRQRYVMLILSSDNQLRVSTAVGGKISLE